MQKPLFVNQCYHQCETQKFKFKTTEKLSDLKEIVGQDRAVHALCFGLDMKNHGYNIYALGSEGTGKSKTIHNFLEKQSREKPIPNDWLYINNFDNYDKPCQLSLPAGTGRVFRDDMDLFVQELKTEVPKIFEEKKYEEEREAIEQEFQHRSKELFDALGRKADERGFRIIQTPQGFAALPVIKSKVVTSEESAELSEKQREKIARGQEEVITEIRNALRQIDQMQKEGRERIRELDQRVVGFSVNHLLDALQEKYSKHENALNFLKKVREHILKNIQTFKQIKQSEGLSAQQRILLGGGQEPSFDEYRVNLLVDNSQLKGAPVIYEKNPTGPNLIGRIEQQGFFGALITNFRMIKAGSLHYANGGYLIVDILDILKKPFSWEVLKRALKNNEIVTEGMMESLGALSTRTLEPESIPLKVKVVLIGNPLFYYLLYELDSEFKEIFKIKADFGFSMPRTEASMQQYAQFIGTVCRQENLKHFDASGVAKMVEYGSRLVDHQNKLSTKFGDIVDVIRQADYWANTTQKKLIQAADVKKALDEKVYRSNRIEELLQEMIDENVIKIDTKGKKVGQINGISVMQMGDYSFGRPSRITAVTHVGSAGFVSVDREVELGGPIHNKGSMIVAAYLGSKFAQQVPLALSASIAFEQSYGGVEGDSASAAEIFALISSLSGFPIRQDLAVTGSVNQHGEIQAIGGVNEKIEGVYEVYKSQGLTGKQGVIIPESNVQHLMLKEEVLDAVKKGIFHIYSIKTIDEGIELLIGKSAGKKNAKGQYPKGSIYYSAQEKIRQYAETAKEFGNSKKKTKR